MALVPVERHRRSYHPTGMDLEGTEPQPSHGRGYPPSVPINDDLQYNPQTLRLMELWRDEVKPFRPKEYSEDNIETRINKFRWLTDRLADVYGIPRPTVNVEDVTAETFNRAGESGSSCYDRSNHTITMRRKLSVITLLHEFGHARGFDETDATMWSVNLFKRIFPISYSKLVGSGHTLIQQEECRR